MLAGAFFAQPSSRNRLCPYLTLIVLGVIILGGLGLQLARRQWAIPLYVLLSVAAICLTPWPIQLVRYLTPLCPFFALAFFTSLLFLKALSGKASSMAVTTVTSFLIASGISLLLFHQLVVFYRFKGTLTRSSMTYRMEERCDSAYLATSRSSEL